MRNPCLLPIALAFLFFGSCSPEKTTLESTEIIVDVTDKVGKLEPIWRFFGYDEANYTLTPEGQSLLTELSGLSSSPVYIRCHHLLTSGDGSAWLKWSSSNAYSEDSKGNPIYDWHIIDSIFDVYIELRLKPFVQIGFMPKDLSSVQDPYTPEPVYTGRPTGMVRGGAFYPPRDYGKWKDFIEAWVRHCTEKYGKEEVLSWYWELWNEPNGGYWKGSTEEYLKLYDYTVAGVKTALPGAMVGGPHITNPDYSEGGEFLKAFLEHCIHGKNSLTGERGTDLDFVVSHAKGGTSWEEDHVQMDMGNHLLQIDKAMKIIAVHPELKDMPVFIGESDPDGCAACASSSYPANGYRNGSQFASYTAATFMRKQEVAARSGLELKGALTWSFMFPGQPWFTGFRTLSTNGVAKPVLNAFRMFSLLGEDRLKVENSGRIPLDSLLEFSVRERADIDAVATRKENGMSVLVWNYHDNDLPGPEAKIRLLVEKLPAGVRKIELTQYRIDDSHSNSYTAWKELGSPQNPDPGQVSHLMEASGLQMFGEPEILRSRNGLAAKELSLPRQSVSLLLFAW